MAEDYPTVRFRYGKVHAVYASGGPEEGSLWGMYTLCGKLMEDNVIWTEEPEARLTCKRCIRAFNSEDYPILVRLLNRQ